MYCNNCGKQINDNVKFCPYCGNNCNSEEVKNTDIKNDNKTSKLLVGIMVAVLFISIATIGLAATNIVENKYIKQADRYIEIKEYDKAIASLQKAPEYMKQSQKMRSRIKFDDNKTSLIDKNGKCRYVVCEYSKWIYDENEDLFEVYGKINGEYVPIFETEYTEEDHILTKINDSLNCEHQYIEYDSEGNLIKDTINSNETSIIRKYDSTGNNIESEEYYWENEINASFKYEYDSAGNLIKRMSYDEDGDLDLLLEYEYDGEGNPIKEIIHHKNGNISYSYNQYEFDNEGNLIQEMQYDEDGNTLFHYKYEYDNEGNLIKDIVYDEDGSILSHCKYEYDNESNLVKSVHYKNEIEKTYFYEHGLDTKPSSPVASKHKKGFEYMMKYNSEEGLILSNCYWEYGILF